MLRLLIKDIAVEKPNQKQVGGSHSMQGGAYSDLCVQIPPNRADCVRYPAAVVNHVRDLAQSLPNAEIAERLNRAGLLSALGKPFTASMIQWIRYRYQIPQVTLARPEELTVGQMAQRFG